jgi:hypothetical protein
MSYEHGGDIPDDCLDVVADPFVDFWSKPERSELEDTGPLNERSRCIRPESSPVRPPWR